MALGNGIASNDHDRVGGRRDGEYTHEWLAHMTAEQLRAHRAQLVRETAMAFDKVPPKNPYQSAAYRRYRYSRWVGMANDEIRSRAEGNVS